MDELVEKMKAEWERVDAYADEAAAWNAAAKVLLEAALGEPSEDEMIATARNGVNWAFGKGLDYDRVRDIFANRKARILGPKTIESRIAEHLDAFLPLETFQARDNAIKQLARELVGLIAEMKEMG